MPVSIVSMAIILTHSDAGHAGATELGVQRYRPERLYTSQHEPWPHDPSFATLRKLQASSEKQPWVWRHLGVDQRIELGPRGTATVLYPGSRDRHDKSDDRALVLMMELEGLRVLWLGDAGFITEKTLLERKTCLECDILIRSHHGSDPSGLTELLMAARPGVMVCSNDRQHVENQLPQRVRDYCAANGVALFDLETCGSVGVAFGNGGATLSAFRNGQSATLRRRER